MEEIWKDAIKIKNDTKAASIGIDIALGAVGTVATAGVLGPMSLLAGAGFAGLEKILDLDRLNVSERFVKFLNKDYLCNIYDFSKKYGYPVGSL